MRNKLFTFISLFGISFTLTLLFVGASFFDYFTKSNYPAFKQDRILYVNHLQMWEEKNGNTYRNFYGGSPSYYLLNKHVRSLETPEKISIFSSFYTKVGSYNNNQKVELNIKHTDAAFWEILDFDFISGRPYRKNEVDEGQKVAVINEELATIFFGSSKEAIGKNLEADKINFNVIGVVKDVSISSLSAYGNIWVPISTSKNDLSRISLKGECAAMLLAENKSDFEKIRNEFQNSIRKINFPIEGYKHIKINTETIFESFVASVDFDKKSFFLAVSILYVIILAIPSLNLINLNITRIRERESEIGIRKSFGSPVTLVLWQFLFENILLTFIGGIIALLFSLLILKSFQSIGVIPPEGIPLNFRIFVDAILFCLIFGVVSGMLPALRMSRLQIVNTLQGGVS